MFVVRTSTGADFLEGFKRNIRTTGERAADGDPSRRPALSQLAHAR